MPQSRNAFPRSNDRGHIEACEVDKEIDNHRILANSCKNFGGLDAQIVLYSLRDLCGSEPNPSGEAITPETSRYCSVWYRIQTRPVQGRTVATGVDADRWLAPLALQAHHLGDVPSTSHFRASDKRLAGKAAQILERAGL